MAPSEERDLERLERQAAWRARQTAWLADKAKQAAASVGRSLWRLVVDLVKGGHNGL